MAMLSAVQLDEGARLLRQCRAMQSAFVPNMAQVDAGLAWQLWLERHGADLLDTLIVRLHGCTDAT